MHDVTQKNLRIVALKAIKYHITTTKDSLHNRGKIFSGVSVAWQFNADRRKVFFRFSIDSTGKVPKQCNLYTNHDP